MAGAAGPLERFRRLPVGDVVRALQVILDAHVAIAAAGWISVDLYDGCFLYDFDAGRMRLIDLDEYRPGAFVLDADRLLGSRRYMAPEEWARGARIDERTTAHHLGRTLQQLLTDDAPPSGNGRFAARATDPDPTAGTRRWPRWLPTGLDEPAGRSTTCVNWRMARRLDGRWEENP